jgi:PIN like domain
MTDPWDKSKKRSSGSSGRKSKQHKFTFWLDEDFDCPEVKDVLDRSHLRYRIYKQDNPSGTEDLRFFPEVGRRGWILITGDRHQRSRPREAYDLRRYGVRHFAMPGNLGARGMAEVLVAAKNSIFACCRENEPPISANIHRDGSVQLIWDKRGRLYERHLEKIYSRGRVKIIKPTD